MPSRELVTRERLGRELAVNAATKPLAIGVGVAVAIAAFVIGAAWLLPAAVALTLRLRPPRSSNGNEAERRRPRGARKGHVSAGRRNGRLC
jgi:hypothetical protein